MLVMKPKFNDFNLTGSDKNLEPFYSTNYALNSVKCSALKYSSYEKVNRLRNTNYGCSFI